jgi:hypothetical protein
MLLVLVTNRAPLALGADLARRLAHLGVSRVAILQDEAGLALALEGWAFDPIRSAGSALEVLGPGARAARSMQQVAEVGIAAGPTDGRESEDGAAVSALDKGRSGKGGSP